MKNVLKLFIFVAMAVSMCSCSLFTGLLIPETVLIDDVNYRNGFYGYLWPQNLNMSEEIYTVDGIEYYKIQNEQFDWVHSFVGEYTCGVLYCSENQWNQAKLYYINPDNYTFYCKVETTDGDSYTFKINDFDLRKFDELVEFQSKNEYIPFNNAHNKKIDTIRTPMPDWNESPQLIFYKESLDGYFTSYMGSYYHIIDEQLYLVYQYDYGHGEIEELICVEVPEELSDYILELTDKYGLCKQN